jgi:hypothetical protein
MLAAEDYQEVNRKYRLGVSYPWVFPLYLLQGNGQRSQFDWCTDLIQLSQALKDTFLLCTTEFDLEGEAAKL